MEVEKNIKKENKHMKIFLIISMVLIILGLLLLIAREGYIYYKQQENKIKEQNQKALKSKSEIVEYGDNISYEDVLSELIAVSDIASGTTYTVKIDGKTLEPTESYKAEKVGDLPIIIETHCSTLLFKNITNQKENIWNVEDTQKPIIEGVSNKEITQGDDFDAKAGIKAVDAVDGNLEIVIEGNVDTTKVGEYKLTVKAVDKNQNETSQEFTVTVKKKEEKTVKDNTNTSKNNTNTSNNNTNTSKNNTNTSNNNTNTSKNNTNTSNNNTNTSKNNTNTSNNNTNTSKNNTNNNNANQTSNPASTKEGRLKLAKEEAKRVVSKIITNGMTKKEKAIAICNYIYETVESQNDQSTEAYKKNYGDEAYAALILKKAACSGRCHAVTLLCNEAGLESQHVNENLWKHQWNKVKIDDGSWLVIDSQINLYGLSHPLEGQ